MSIPKIFISYSWSSPTHQEWVIQLASELIESGVQVILDKWDLKVGQESIAFMEQMVTDPSIDKVIIISDRIYANKADGRLGGVGTETQIISKQIYEQIGEERFIAIISEKDENGKPYLPTFYNSRVYIDLSQVDSYSENFEALIRCIYGQPQFIKPPLGKKPEFLNDSSISLGTSAAQKRVLSAIREAKPHVSGALSDYLIAYSEKLEKLRVAITDNKLADDIIAESINLFLPARNEFIQVISTASQYLKYEDFIFQIHSFFESLINYFSPPPGTGRYTEWDFDNYKFFAHELFLYTIAILIRKEHFLGANELLTKQYYMQNNNYGRSGTESYTVFCQQIKSIEHRNQRLGLNKVDLHATILHERSTGTGVNFSDIMQADFILFIRSQVDSDNYWWPSTLVYKNRFHSAFEVFSRASSSQYFNKIKHLINVKSKSDIKILLDEFSSGQKRLPTFDYSKLNPSPLLNYEELETRL